MRTWPPPESESFTAERAVVLHSETQDADAGAPGQSCANVPVAPSVTPTPQLNPLHAAIDRHRESPLARALYAVLLSGTGALRIVASTLDKPPVTDPAARSAIRSFATDVFEMAAQLERRGALLIAEVAHAT